MDDGDLTIWKDGVGRTTSTHRDGDANGDGGVDGADFLLWQRDYGVSVELNGDFDGDGAVSDADLALWQAGYGMLGTASTHQGDANGDHHVDGSDFLVWQRSYSDAGLRGAAGEAVPEPTSNFFICALGLLNASGANRKTNTNA